MRKKILVVDDDTAVRESLINALSYEDYLPLGAANGDEALRMIDAEKPDLVLLDINMPGKNGWDVFEHILRKHPLLAVIILTARPNQLFTSLGAGVGALIEKPFDFFKLLEIIRELLSEPVEERVARLAGHASSFQYIRPNGNDITYSQKAACNSGGSKTEN
jgi:two-component system alkaline phosphatase synthesis response regulator PhoP